MDWQYFVLGVIAYQILKMLALAINRSVIEHRQKKFLKLVNIEFPDNSKITFIALDTSDKRAMAKLERELRAQFNIPEEQDEDRGRDRGLNGSLRRTASRHREGPPR